MFWLRVQGFGFRVFGGFQGINVVTVEGARLWEFSAQFGLPELLGLGFFRLQQELLGGSGYIAYVK